MKKNYVLLFVLSLIAACSSGFSIPDPVKSSEDPGNHKKEEAEASAAAAAFPGLAADGNDEGTYRLILDRGYNYETPDYSGGHASAPYRHIRQSWDESLKKYVFDFYLHIQNDDDRGKANITDRQRNEIKTDAHSPDSLVAQYGETLRMSWKFCLPDGMKTTNKFAHIHQLKGIDNAEGNADVGLPAVTFTCRSAGGGQQLQVIYTASKVESDGSSTYLAKLNLADFLGEWVSVSETVLFSDEGKYSVVITRIRDGKQLLKLSNIELDTWRSDCTGMRPKWGLYRNFGEGRSLAGQLRDEVLKFADFEIHKLK